MAYQASITAFTHVHYVNGVLITHSHPFHNQHSHSTDSLIVIGLLSHFSSDTPDCCELQHPMRSLLQVMESETDTNAWYAPYQRWVFVVPMLGIRCTNLWYSPYQCLVSVVPAFGTCRTKYRYRIGIIK